MLPVLCVQSSESSVLLLSFSLHMYECMYVKMYACVCIFVCLFTPTWVKLYILKAACIQETEVIEKTYGQVSFGAAEGGKEAWNWIPWQSKLHHHVMRKPHEVERSSLPLQKKDVKDDSANCTIAMSRRSCIISYTAFNNKILPSLWKLIGN